jgi:predicted transcriptional regulator of viral defense system
MEQLPYFNKITLGEILGKSGENLNYWIKILLKKGEIIALKKGLYVSKLYLIGLERSPQLRELYLEYLANIIRYPSYISLEYVLGKYGALPENVYAITSLTLKTSRIYKNKLGTFIYRNIKENLFANFTASDFEGKRIKIATRAKALFDFLYYKNTQDPDEFRINWSIFNKDDRGEFKQIVAVSKSAKMERLAKVLRW